MKQPAELWHLVLVALILAAGILLSHQETHVEHGESMAAHDEELHAVREELEEEIHAIREELSELVGHMAHDEEGG